MEKEEIQKEEQTKQIIFENAKKALEIINKNKSKDKDDGEER